MKRPVVLFALTCIWPLQMRLRRQRGLLSQQRPKQLAVYRGCTPGVVFGTRARLDGLVDAVAGPGRLAASPDAGMSRAAVVRVDAGPASTSAPARP